MKLPLAKYFGIIFTCLCFTLNSQVNMQEMSDESTFLLMHAAMQGDMDTIQKTFFERGGINTRDSNGLTALHYAILNHQEEAALFLIENGANILVCDRWGNTPLILAKARNLTSVVEALERTFAMQYAYYDPQELQRYESSKRFAIIVPSYNNSPWCEEGLASIFNQKYENYYVVFVDDCSKDGNAEIAEQFIKKHSKENRCQIIKNQNRRFKMANLYNAIHRCQDSDIAVIMDGDDRFSDNEVLSYFNDLYRTKNIWLTAGGYKEYPSNVIGFCRPVPAEVIKKNSFRMYGGTTSQLRTFYVWLFKQLSLEDLFFEGKFFRTASDVAKMMPMFELSGERIECNQRVVYIYNLANTINDHKVDAGLQVRSCEDVLNRKKRYTRLEKPLPSPETNALQAKAAVVVFADGNQDFSNLISKITMIQDVVQVMILCETSKSYETCRELVKNQPSITALKLDDHYPSFEQYFHSVINSVQTDYILFLDNSSPIVKPLKMNALIRSLERTGAYTWHGKHSQLIAEGRPYLESLPQENLYAWQFDYSLDDWKKSHSFDMALYRKKDVLAKLDEVSVSSKTISSFKDFWSQQSAQERAVGLCSSVDN